MFTTSGTCCKEMEVIMNGNIMEQITFRGGCPGNLSALKKVMEGKSYKEFLGVFANNSCGNKPTSCMAQFDTLLNMIDKHLSGEIEYPFVANVA